LSPLEVATRAICDGQALRRVILFDPRVPGLVPYETVPFPAVVSGYGFDWPDRFARTLVQGLVHGVEDGPALLDVDTLVRAIDARFVQTRYYIEDEWIGAPAELTVVTGIRPAPDTALGLNPAVTDPKRTDERIRKFRGGPLPLDAATVEQHHEHD
jgi:hypothetical protein